MAKVLITEDYLSDIGDAIRGKLGGSNHYTPGQMASAINSIPTVAPTLISKSIVANGTYDAEDDNADGYDSVSVNVPNSYSAQDEGKVVSSGALVAQESQSVSQNGTYNTTLKNQVVVSVPNTYEVSDNGKVVVNQALTDQTSKSINTNGTHDTTANNSVVVDVPNSYAAADEGKVVSNGSLVSQGSRTITENGTYDTRLISELTANISGGGGGGSTNILSGTDAPTASVGSDGAIFLQHSALITNVRMVIYGVRSSGGDTQVTEVELLDENDNVIVWGSGTATSNGNVYTSSQQADKAFDGITNNKWYTNSKPSASVPIWIDFEFEEPILLDIVKKWRWYTGGDSPNRDPVTFDLQVKRYGADHYTIIDSAENESITSNRNAVAYTKAVTASTEGDEISNAYLKVNGAWQYLIGSDIDDVNTGGNSE